MLVKHGVITINGSVVKDPGVQVDPAVCKIEIDGKEIKYKKNIYIMMNKPAGVISATFDNRQRTVIDILPDEFKKFAIFPAGRLDVDTEGLMFLTNDGQLAHEILSPKKHIPKTYYARVEGVVTFDDVENFSSGITLEDGYKCLPAKLEVLESRQVSQIN